MLSFLLAFSNAKDSAQNTESTKWASVKGVSGFPQREAEMKIYQDWCPQGLSRMLVGCHFVEVFSSLSTQETWLSYQLGIWITEGGYCWLFCEHLRLCCFSFPWPKLFLFPGRLFNDSHWITGKPKLSNPRVIPSRNHPNLGSVCQVLQQMHSSCSQNSPWTRQYCLILISSHVSQVASRLG